MVFLLVVQNRFAGVTSKQAHLQGFNLSGLFSIQTPSGSKIPVITHVLTTCLTFDILAHPHVTK
jgi:hypothetical protein